MLNIPFNTPSENSGKHPQLDEILPQIKQEFQEIYQEDLIGLFLFGSQARGEAKADSDIDVLVVLKEKKNPDNRHKIIINFIADLCIEYGVLVSCVYVSESQFNQEKSPLLLNIHQEGILL